MARVRRRDPEPDEATLAPDLSIDGLLADPRPLLEQDHLRTDIDRLAWARENRPDLVRTHEQARDLQARQHEPKLSASAAALALAPPRADPLAWLLAHHPEELTVRHPVDLDDDDLADWAAEHAPGVARFEPDHRRIGARR